MKKHYLFFLLTALIAFSSCASWRIEKRHYNDGWYVDFGNDKKTETVVQSGESPNVSSATPAANEETVAPAKENETTVVKNSPESVPANETKTSSATEQNKQETPDPNASAPQVKNQSAASADQDPANEKPTEPAGDDQVLYIILAIIIPPLAVYLVQGVTTVFWITLICWLFGGVFFFGHGGILFLGGLGLVAIVLALLAVFGKI